MTSASGIKSEEDVLESVVYYDGLGRVKQNIGIKASEGASALSDLATNVAEWKMDWTIGSGSTGFYNKYGQDSDNSREYGPDPFGNTSILWQCGNDPNPDPDGGWESDTFNVDKTASYLYTVWVKRTHSQNGATYHGTRNILNLNGSSNGNPYFWYGDLPQLNTWYLMVGIVHPHTHSGGDTGISGVYDINGNKVVDSSEFKWQPGTSTSSFRSYFYSSTDVNNRQYFFNPQLRKLTGNEASITEILQGMVVNDLVTHVAYDAFGRQDKSFLPTPVSGTAGTLKTTAETATHQYYQNAFPEDISLSTSNPFSQTDFEPSPLSRVLKQAAPGHDWRMGGGNEIESSYLSNNSSEVRRFDVNTTWDGSAFIPSFTSNGHYTSGQLFKSGVKDENHPGGTTKNHITEEFKDKSGKVILKRTYADIPALDLNNDGDMNDPGEQAMAEAPHDTYYLYDNFGNLSYVIPPKVVTSDGVSATELTELCYQYIYDHKNRLLAKKLPGKGWEYIVYNKLDQPVMTKDSQNPWLFTKYDAFGRVAYTGFASGGSRASVQTAADNFGGTLWTAHQNSANSIAGTTIHYNSNGFPASGSITEIHTINYYDTYSFDRPGLTLPGTVFGEPTITGVKGLATGTKIRILDTNQWITTMLGYDGKGRNIWTKSTNNYLQTTDELKTQLDFGGKVLKTESTHQKGAAAAIVTTDEFRYDRQGRLVRQEQTLGGQTEILVHNHYDALGQLASKEVGGGLQTVDYKYNVRGWLKAINDPGSLGSDLFAFGINYNTADHSGTKLYNGNIAETEWKTANDNVLRWYRYTYDPLNRIKTGISNDGKFNLGSTAEPITYDKNGNITFLKRWGHVVANPNINTGSHYGVMDQLVYSYDSGNKLQKVADGATTDQYGFKDDAVNTASDTSNDYTYDANGNLITDANKGITSITYNHLNLPKQVSIGGGTISYIYDATGIKQKKLVSTGTTTEYAGNYIYENGYLQFINHPEGYLNSDGSGGYDYIYQYKDHLGNIRLSYKDTFGNYEQLLNSDFENGFDGWEQNGSVNYSLENGRLRVNVNSSWEGVKHQLNNFMVNPGETYNLNVVFDKGNTLSNVRLYFQELDSNGNTLSWNVVNGNLQTGSYAYNYTVNSGNKLILRIDKDNTNTSTETIFYVDHVSLTRNSLETLTEKNYYPFGLKHRGYNSSNSPLGNDVAQRWKYNGKELEESLGLEWLDFGFRNYDASIGRWMSPDPLADLDYNFSQYAYTLNNPINLVDPDGLSTHVDEDGNVVAVYDDGDTGVYKHSAEALKDFDPEKMSLSIGPETEMIGETEYWDEFRAHDKKTGEVLDDIIDEAKIEIGESWDETIEELSEEASNMSLKEVAGESVPNGDFDIKSKKDLAPSGSGTGKLLNGKYATARSAGNYLAGMNGATQKTGWMGQMGAHISKDTYMKLAGALHTGNWGPVNAALILTFGKSFGTAPYYGEIPYAGRMISKGFDAGVKKRK